MTRLDLRLAARRTAVYEIKRAGQGTRLTGFGNWVRGPGAVRTVSDLTSTSEGELLRRIATGDSAALSEFYDLRAGTLYAFAIRILNDPKEAEDVLQEVFVQIWEKASKFDPDQGRPFSWVLALTRNRAIDRLRSAQRRARLIEEAGAESLDANPAPVYGVPEAVPAADEAELVRAALGRLPADQRRAIELAFFNGLTQTEVAAALNEPLGTIKARIRRGMLKLRDELQPSLWHGAPSAPPNTPT